MVTIKIIAGSQFTLIANINMKRRKKISNKLILDASGMDCRSMLKKKKYAKWGNDDGGPDWGDLKHNDKEEEPCLAKAPEVGSKLVQCLNLV